MSNAYILIVEDDNNDEELAKLALEGNDIQINLKICRDGIDACDFLFSTGEYNDQENELPYVVFLDLKLPKFSGLEVLKKIRANERTRYLPVVIFTSSKEESDIKNAYESGANAFVAKPISFSDFSATIQQAALFWVLYNKTTPN